MHDYTLRRIHEDRTREFERAADKSTLAKTAMQGRPRQQFRAAPREAAAWLSGRLGILSGNPDAATPVHREAHGGLVADAIHPVVEGQ